MLMTMKTHKSSILLIKRYFRGEGKNHGNSTNLQRKLEKAISSRYILRVRHLVRLLSRLSPASPACFFADHQRTLFSMTNQVQRKSFILIVLRTALLYPSLNLNQMSLLTSSDSTFLACFDGST